MRSGIIALGLLLATVGCSSTTGGNGAVSGTPAGSASSRPDFPAGASGSGGATAPAASSAAGSSAPASPTTHPVPSTPLRTATVHAGDGVTYVVQVWAEVRNDTCFDHAYGTAIVTFLTQHPCRGLSRILATTTVGGRPVGFAMSGTGFAGPASDPYKWASEFIKLENAQGTGSINDLMREGYRLPQGPTQVPAGEAFNVLGQDNGVTVWDVWYLDGPTPDNAKPLMKMTEDLFLQF